MLLSEYNNFTFYAHNLGIYDCIFIYNILLKSNEIRGYNYYNLNISTRDNGILKLTISIKPNSRSKAIKIHLLDSLNLLNASLDKLSVDFNSNTQKTYFPYLFVSRYTLSYIEETPATHQYPKLNKFNIEDRNIYNSLVKKD